MEVTKTGEGLKRVVGLPAFSISIVNNSIGSGMFVLPAIVGIQLGAFGIFCYLFCGIMLAAIIIGNKAHITDWLMELYKDKIGVFGYELTRKVENVFDDIVIVLYDVTQQWTNEKNEVVKKSTYKITHTWKKSGNGWLIIGGMGANK